MSEEKQFSFNIGDTPLCPVEIVGLCGGKYGTKAIVELDDGTQGKVYKSSLVPAPKGGEYRLTVEELDAFAYAHHAAKLDIFSNFADKEFRLNWVKHWLQEKGKEQA